MNKKQQIQQLRDKRYTYQQIGNLFGISRQRVHQILTGYQSPLCKKIIIDAKNRIRLKIDKHKKLGINTNGINFKGRERTREIVRMRDNYTCQLCGRIWKEGKRRFDVHHIDCDNKKTHQYDKIDGVRNMITLCHKCHMNLEEHRLSMRK